MNKSLGLIFAVNLMMATSVWASEGKKVEKRDMNIEKVEELSKQLKDLANSFDDEVNGDEIEKKSVRKEVYRAIKQSTNTIDRAAERIRSRGTGKVYGLAFTLDDRNWSDEGDKKHEHDFSEWDYLYLAYTYRGAGPVSDFSVKDRTGLEIGLTLPILYGIDVGFAMNSMFTKGADVQKVYKTRLYLVDEQNLLYIGAEYLPDYPVVEKDDRGLKRLTQKNHVAYTIGSTFGIVYGELDFVPDEEAPYRMEPEIGLRVSFM